MLGSRHSFNNIADTSEDLISLSHFNRVLELDREDQTVTVEPAVRYGELCPYLDREGFAIHNLASLPHISVAGACSTSTHGSGDNNGSLATSVAALEMVTTNGEVVTLSRDEHPEEFFGAVVGLGGLGVIIRVMLDVLPAFEMRQYVYENMPLAQLLENFDEIMSAAYSVSLFTDWSDDIVNQVWVKQRLDDEGFEAEPEWFGAVLAPTHRHPIVELSAEPTTPQMGEPGPWYERLPHFRTEFTPSSGEELQAEYLVPRKHALEALLAVDEMRDKIAPVLQISEIRTVAADDLWMSPFYQEPGVGIHFTLKKDWEAVRELLPLIEAQLEPFELRPHWAKLFTMAPDQLQSRYERLPDFQRLANSYDPEGKLRNDYLNTYIFGAG